MKKRIHRVNEQPYGRGTLEVNNGHFIKAALKELMPKLPLGGLLVNKCLLSLNLCLF